LTGEKNGEGYLDRSCAKRKAVTLSKKETNNLQELERRKPKRIYHTILAKIQGEGRGGRRNKQLPDDLKENE
jgi:hypothetical protein